MLRFIPPNTTPWKGEITHQYTWPSSPCGWNSARCVYTVRPASLRTRNSSQASPGSRISARNRSSRSGSISSTRQKSSVSPMNSRSGSRRPRFRPTPPMVLSMRPRTLHASGKEYQPRWPPIPSITRPLGVGGQRIAGPSGDGGGGPAGGNVRLAHPLQGQLDRPLEAGQPLRRICHIRGDVVLTADHLVSQRLHQRPGQSARHWRDQADPEAGQARGEERDRQYDPSWQPGNGGVAAHHVGVGKDVRTPDVEGPIHIGRKRGATDQISQHISDGDRLNPAVHPAWGDHHRQALGEVAQHLEGG